mmetsp:Transcript_22651/g.70347  ORF Transcript_22651/g.70347 Transcript_22651/m.70347 type:complete len:113 (-) Transcript_22651:79-417(-)
MSGLRMYRELLRSSRAAFKGDQVMVAGARDQIREKFQERRGETDSEAIKGMLQEGKETADFLRSYVVQGVLNERGNYEMKLESHHAEGADKIHAEEALPEVVNAGGCGSKNK